MPIVFRTTPTGIQQGPYSQLIVSPITNLSATSSVAGQIVLTWSGGAGYNVKYSYALSSGTIQSTSGINPTTITLTSTNSVTTTVTLTETVLGGSASAVSNSVTTVSPNGTAHFVGYDSTSTNGSYTIFAYTTPKTTSNAITFTTNSVPIYAFVLAGGGSGGGYNGGGGGAGGLLQNALTSTVSDTVSITVAAQTVNTASTNNAGTTGNNSTFIFTNQTSLNITANGGGGGGTYNGGFPNGVNGGSGGGASNSGTPGSGIAGQGYGGGTNSNNRSGGGGGAGGVGGNSDGTVAGNGGTGVQINTTTLPAFAGTTYATYYWAGGGGGAAYPNGLGQGGAGGGASAGVGGVLSGTAQNSASSINAPSNENAGANTGGGGGGDQNPASFGGKGGSGIVLVGILTSYVV